MTSDYFAFKITGRTYAIPATAIERVVLAQRVVPVPTTPSHVRGVIHLAGRILAVIDLASLLGVEGGEPERIVLVSARGYVFGVLVDAALGMWFGEPGAPLEDGPLVGGMLDCEAGVAATLDPDAIIAAIIGGGAIGDRL